MIIDVLYFPANRKDPHPSLSDPIYKLQKIHENGDRHRLLEKMHINQVHDFLWFYNMDANRLRNVSKQKFYYQLICICSPITFYNINMYLYRPI